MKILYVNHTEELGGAEHSLLTLLEGLPEDIVPIVASPVGPLRDRVRALGIRVETVPGTTGSFRLHPVRTPRALVDIARSAAAVRSIAHRLRVDLIHANSVRAGLISTGSRAIGSPPVIVHVRDAIPPGRTGMLVRAAVKLGARRTICISEYVAHDFGNGCRTAVIPNGVDLNRFDPTSHDRTVCRASLGVAPDELALGVIAQITPWKGQDVAIAALAEVRRRQPLARLFLVGEAKFLSGDSRFDNRAFQASLARQVRQAGIEDAVTLLGEQTDIAMIMHALDVVLVPSWAEPFGRSVIEGMAMERAVLATSVGGPKEIIDDGVTGLLAAPRDVGAWTRQIIRLVEDHGLRSSLGRAGRASLVDRFDASTHVRRIVDVYRGCCPRRTGGSDAIVNRT